MSEAVNEAVERAHRAGGLDAASLMVNGPAAADAVRRARALPDLQVGLHVVAVEGQAALPAAAIPDLVDGAGWFGSDQAWRGVRYYFSARAHGQLRAEIAAQFRKFAETRLPLSHADAHKHMQVHPTVGRMMIEEGARFGLRRLRVPAEPPAVVRACGERPGVGAEALYRWCGVLRGMAVRAGLRVDDAVFGIAFSGRFTWARMERLLAVLPVGDVEIYTHPAVARDEVLARLMPGYDHVGEFEALLAAGAWRAGRAPAA